MATNKNVGSALAAAAVGALAGVAAVMLASPKNRKQVQDKVDDLKKTGSKYLHDLQQDAEEGTKMAERKVKKMSSRVRKGKGGDK